MTRDPGAFPLPPLVRDVEEVAWALFCYRVIGLGRGSQGLELVSYTPSLGPDSALRVSSVPKSNSEMDPLRLN